MVFMANWRKTKTPGVYVAHRLRCPAQETDDTRCRCEPSWRGRRRHPITGKPEWQVPVTTERSEVLAWLGAGEKGRSHLRKALSSGRTLESIGDEWMAGVIAGRIGRRKGRGKPYTATTVRDYTRSYRNFLRPEFGPFPADDIGEVEWQMWVDHLSREGLSRSRITPTSRSRPRSTPGPSPRAADMPSEIRSGSWSCRRRRKAAAPGRIRAGSRAAARRSPSRGRGAVRDRFLRGSPPRRDRAPGMAGRARGPTDRPASPRLPRQERSRPRAPATGG
jgi:hypothetical protein